jgi:hypothetical protein
VSGRLGCADAYQASVYTPGKYYAPDPVGGGFKSFTGQRLFDVDAVTGAEWERRLNDLSLAEVTVSKRMLTDACCQRLAVVEPWMHELAVFRDGQLVWQGPILKTVETRGQWVAKACDVSRWLDVWPAGAPNPVAPLAGGPGVPTLQQVYPMYGPADAVLVYQALLNDSIKLLSTLYDYPLIQANIQYVTGAAQTTYRPKVGLSLGDALREIGDATLDTTVIGRRVVVMPTGYTFGAAVAVLSELDFGDELEVTADGDPFAQTVMIVGAENGEPNANLPDHYMDGVTAANQSYGQVWRYWEMGDVTDPALLRAAAARILPQVNPVPVVLRVPDDAKLDRAAPVTVDELVPGSRIDVAMTEGWCRPLRQSYRLVRASGKWDSEQGEQVGVSLVSLTDPAQPR